MPVVVTDIFESRLVLTDVQKYVSDMNRAGSAIGALEGRMNRLQGISLATGAAAGVIVAGYGKAVGAAARMQLLQTGFKTMLGSADAAKAKIKELQDFAERTPFSMEDVISGFQGLKGANLEVSKILPLMEAMGNVLTANGKSSEDFGEAMRQVIQTIALGKVEMDELRVISQRGIPMGEMLKELGPGKHSAEQLVQALIKLGNSAKYATAMKDQAGTLSIALSNLRDSSIRLGDAIGSPLLPMLTGAANAMTGMAKAVGEAPAPVKVLVSILGVGMVGALGAASVASKILFWDTMRLIAAQRLLETQAKKTGATVAASAVGSAAVSTGANAVGAAGTAAATAGGYLSPKAYAAARGMALSGGTTAAASAATTAVASTAARTGIMAGLRVGAKFLGPIGVAAAVGEAAYLGYQWWNAEDTRGGKPAVEGAGAAGGGTGREDELQLLREQNELLKNMHGAIIKRTSAPASTREVLDGATIYRALGRAVA